MKKPIKVSVSMPKVTKYTTRHPPIPGPGKDNMRLRAWVNSPENAFSGTAMSKSSASPKGRVRDDLKANPTFQWGSLLVSRNPTHLVIPAQAGIHGLSGKFDQRPSDNRKISAMDSRLRGNDKVEDCEEVRAQNSPSSPSPLRLIASANATAISLAPLP